MNEEANFPHTILAKRIGSQKKIDIFSGKEYSGFSKRNTEGSREAR